MEGLLVWYLKLSGQRSVEKFWRKQLAATSAAVAQAAACKGVAAGDGAATRSFDIRLATVREHSSLVDEISSKVNAAYVRELKEALLSSESEAEATFSRTSPIDIRRRLITDDEIQKLKCPTSPPIINRVLFLAVSKDGRIVGTCAATLAAPWCPSGVGSWGLLAVSEPRQGIGRALVEHCERYIKLAMLGHVRIEYFNVAGVPSSDALREWYEERLGYVCFQADPTGRSYRGNEVRGEVSFRHCEKQLHVPEDVFNERVEGRAESTIFDARKRRLAKFLLEGVKSA